VRLPCTLKKQNATKWPLEAATEIAQIRQDFALSATATACSGSCDCLRSVHRVLLLQSTMSFFIWHSFKGQFVYRNSCLIAHPRDSFYLHCDGALLSSMMPSIDFTQKAYAKPFNQVLLQVARYSVGQCPAAVSRCRAGNKQARHLEQHIDTTIMMMGNRNRQ
jgi:hypothetical protein